MPGRGRLARELKRFVKAIAIIVVALAIVGGALYQFFGLRLQIDGGGGLHLRFVRSADAQAAVIERHREAQRAATPAPATPSAVPPAAPQPDTAAPAATLPAAPAASAAAGSAIATGWTSFRGPLRDGHFRDMPIVTSWPSSGLKPMWKQPAGGGYASFVIEGGRAFTIEQRRAEEVVVAYDVLTGRELWKHGWSGKFQEMMGGDGPRATPTWFDGHVYALGALGELRCLDASSGRLVWRVNILEDNNATNLPWGMAASPLIVGDTVVVLPGGSGGRSVVAYDRRTGKRVWSAQSDRPAYASPVVVTLSGTPQMLVVSASRLMGLTPDRGEVLWEYPWVTQYDVNAAQPMVIGDNRVFISSGYGTGAAVLEITPSADRFSVREIWRNNRMKNQFSSSLLHDGFIYGLDESILACLDAATGQLKWKGGRYGYGQVMLASGHLIVLTEDGDLALVRATPDRHDEVVRFPVLDGKTWNHPAMAGGILLVRNLQEMAAFDLRK